MAGQTLYLEAENTSSSTTLFGSKGKKTFSRKIKFSQSQGLQQRTGARKVRRRQASTWGQFFQEKEIRTYFMQPQGNVF